MEPSTSMMQKYNTRWDLFTNQLGRVLHQVRNSVGGGYRPNKPTPINSLAAETLMVILKCLSTKDLIRASHVCKSWKVLANDPLLWKRPWLLTNLFPKLTVIDEQVWQENTNLDELGLSFADFPDHDNRSLIPILKSFALLPFEGAAGMTLLTIPKGLKFSTLQQLADVKLETYEFFMWHPDADDWHKSAVEKTYQVVIGNSILKGSRNQPKAIHQELLAKACCEMPEVLPISAQIILTLLSNPDAQPYPDPKPSQYIPPDQLTTDSTVNQKTFTRCVEDVAFYNRYRTPETEPSRIYRTVGRVSIEGGYGFNVASNYYMDYGQGHKAIGVGAMKKIPASPNPSTQNQ